MANALLRLHWRQIQADCHRYWGKLTDEDVQRIDGRYAEFVLALRKRYGFSQIKAEDELERFLFQYSDRPHGQERRALVDAPLPG